MNKLYTFIFEVANSPESLFMEEFVKLRPELLTICFKTLSKTHDRFKCSHIVSFDNGCSPLPLDLILVKSKLEFGVIFLNKNTGSSNFRFEYIVTLQQRSCHPEERCFYACVKYKICYLLHLEGR